MSVAVRRALYGKLAGDSTLTNLLGSAPSGYSQNIYYEEAPSGAAYPLVVFFKSSGTPAYAFASRAFDNEMWTIKGIDRNSTADKAEAISTRLDALLTDGALTISGKTQLYLRRESDVDYPETSDGVTYRHSGAVFRLIYQ